MTQFIYPILATLVVSLISVVGILVYYISGKKIQKFLLLLVGLSAGTMLGGGLLHLLPEAVEAGLGQLAYVLVLVGFSLFFVIERALHWHHNHHCEGHCEREPKALPYMNIIGDAMHNFIDGLVIASAFSVDARIGLITTAAVIIHEIPQEISDFGVLLFGGFSKSKALFYNFLSATMAIIGAILGVWLSGSIENFSIYLLPITAGGFIYIAASDLIPEINQEHHTGKVIVSFLFFLLGMLLMVASKYFLTI
jgi:zinc and cadmium transporter